jgi:hypothetical protein
MLGIPFQMMDSVRGIVSDLRARAILHSFGDDAFVDLIKVGLSNNLRFYECLQILTFELHYIVAYCRQNHSVIHN